MQLEFYWDEAGDARARGGGAQGLVARFLESDVQTSRRECQDILQAIDRIVAGKLRSWEDTGNSFTLILSSREARLESEVDLRKPPAHVPLAELRGAVADWLAFLERGRPEVRSGPKGSA
ncbi:MAG: YacL family protein [Acidobacteriota bacterium]|nr:YacL family protein [Acidobacteriota bacterium]